MKSFNVVHHDGAIVVGIQDDGRALIDVKNINDDEVLVRAINRAFREELVLELYLPERL